MCANIIALTHTDWAADEWRRRIRADLLWTLQSAPLVRLEVWQAVGVQLATCSGWTLPEDLPSLQAIAGFHKPLRLGHHFEQIHGLLLGRQSDLRTLTCNQRVGDGSRTLGEVDCLYATATEVVHRELAVKFYLSRDDSGEAFSWVGPSKLDRLDLKLERLLRHQTQLARLAAQNGVWPTNLPFPTRTEVMMQGAFFRHPSHRHWPHVMHEHAETGFWCTSEEFAEQAEGPWARLRKPWWLSPLHSGYEPTLSGSEIANLVESQQTPWFVGCQTHHRGPLGQRGFVVPQAWPRS